MSSEPTISDVLDAIGDFSTKVDGRFERIESEIGVIKSEIVGIKSDITGMKSDIVGIKNQMVTKAYLDDKLIDLKADLTVVMRKEDHKLEALTRLLAAKKIISETDANGILSLEPFPQGV
jgi:archaellum component FlaC